MPYERPEAEARLRPLAGGERGERVDVDEMGGSEDAIDEERDEALASGEKLRLVTRLAEQRERVVERLGAGIGEGRRFHRRLAAATIGP